MRKLIIIVTIILGISYVDIIINNHGIVAFYGDNIEQIYPFYTHLIKFLRNWPIQQWDISVGFGASLFIFFFNAPLGSPFLWLATFLEVDSLPYFFLFSDFLRFLLIAIFSYLWIRKISKNELSRIVGSVVVTFSGWFMFYMHYNAFLDAYLYIPLLLYLSEEVLQNRKCILFSFVIFLSIIASLYHFYIFSWLLFIYLSLRYLLKNEKLKFKDYMVEFVKVFKYYIIGVGISSSILFPLIYIISTSPRIGVIDFNLFIPDASKSEFLTL